MKQRKIALVLIVATFVFYAAVKMFDPKAYVLAQTNAPTPAPAASPSPEFNQPAAIAKLKEQIKGKENEPAETVFKNIQMMKGTPAGRLLAIMEFGYARSLGVSCNHCHMPEKWESDEKNTKQIAREMSDMVKKINGDLLKNIKNLKSETPIINCTTCHRGQTKPALNLPPK
jgi:Photosynthetic reaction centre cytochrome C subunit